MKSRIRLISRTRTALWLVAKDPSLKLFRRVLWEKLTQPFVVNPSNWVPYEILNSEYDRKAKTPPKVAIAVHLFYEEYVEILRSALETFPLPFDLLITTPNESIAKMCEAAFALIDGKLIVRRTPNRGRNFGPMLVEFGAQLKEYDLVIHVHSKKSFHLKDEFATKWSDDLWQSLLCDPEVIGRALTEFISNEKLGVYYPLTALPFEMFTWAATEPIAKKWCREHGVDHIGGRVPYPAGGMLWFKPQAMSPILDASFSYSDFPEEAGQLDETMQHALERLVGTVPLSLGFGHLVYDVRLKVFTSDLTFAKREFLWLRRRRQKALNSRKGQAN